MLLEDAAKNIGGILASARTSNPPGLGRKQICDQAGVSERTLAKIESGDPSVSLSRYLSVANVLGMTWLFDLFAPSENRIKVRYLTGITALNIPIEGRAMADWHTTYIANTRAWCIAGANFSSTQWLIGLEGVYKATETLRKAGVSFGMDIYAASYERAVFDLLYEFCVVRGRPIPNIQASDIDDAVNFQRVVEWIDQSADFIENDKLEAMKSWLRDSDYDFNGDPKAA